MPISFLLLCHHGTIALGIGVFISKGIDAGLVACFEAPIPLFGVVNFKITLQGITMSNALSVNFHGTDLFIIEQDGQPYTPMKTIVEGMGLAWQSQLAKLNSNPER